MLDGEVRAAREASRKTPARATRDLVEKLKADLNNKDRQYKVISSLLYFLSLCNDNLLFTDLAKSWNWYLIFDVLKQFVHFIRMQFYVFVCVCVCACVHVRVCVHVCVCVCLCSVRNNGQHSYIFQPFWQFISPKKVWVRQI